MINNEISGAIKQGFVILLGVEREDTKDDCDWLCKKLLSLRVFSDSAGKMNLSIMDISGECLVISQFTLHASTKKGNRPSFIKAASQDQAKPLYQGFISRLQSNLDQT